ncbi:DUF1641 domain-containing protein [Rubricoccus marinus]|uniref:DUF1641 domain-containing protein n=1 Tax=Rubricoccus marinus TaxID=716817 RepID=A0A259TUL6_9BACT|nr:DUF1641 domain-containing protein [Rubricoccus marinus]OZC01433.1 hypothetical protein BSZ36_17290 [Rubricoccus marinus]
MPDAAPNGHATPAPPADPLLARLDAIERRLARIEPALDALGDAPGLASMAVDVVDEQAGRLRDRGVDPEARLVRLLELTERLTADDTMAAIEGALALASDAPGLASMAVDIVDERAGALRDRGVDVQARLGRAGALLERLSDDKTMDGLEAALAFADGLPGLASMVVDIVDERLGALRDRGMDPAVLLAQGGEAAAALIESGVLDPESIAAIGDTASALRAARLDPPKKVGLLGLAGALRDDDVQRAAGFLVAVARHLGQSLAAPSRLPARTR